MSPVVRMHGVCKSFPGVRALDDARLELEPGEVHVLLGENGAGKSTLMKVLCGQHPADSGQIEIDGRPAAPRSPHEAEALGLIMIHQELNLVESLGVADNIYLGHEPRRAGLLDAGAMKRGARELLERLGSDLDPDARVAELSVAQKQLVEIARALRVTPKVLVMDEPTAALAESEIHALFEVIRSLCRRGVAIVYISHRMDEIFEIGDRITVMRDGRHVGTRSLREITVDDLIRMMVGRAIDEQIPKRQVALGKEILRVERLRSSQLAGQVSFSLRQGEILGLAGLMGSGRSEVARAVFGADRRTGGRVEVAGRALAGDGPRGAIRGGIGFITEDRKGQGLVLQRSVGENLALASLGQVMKTGLVSRARERLVGDRMAKKLSIRSASLDQRVGELSGGNQQKVVIAKWLAARCRVLIFDEPTRGIDVGAKAEIYGLIGDLVEQGVAVLLISSEMPELLGLADRVVVMHERRLQGILSRSEATQESIMELALGRSQPYAA